MASFSKMQFWNFDLILTEIRPLVTDIMGYQEDELGPYFIASLFSSFMLGCNLIQSARYFSVFQSDPPLMKAGIGVLLFVGILYTVLSSMTSYQVLVLDFGHINVENVPWTFALDPFLTSTVSTIVQGFYGWRLYKICQNVVLPSLVFSCAALAFLTSVTASVIGLKHGTLDAYIPFKWLLAIWLGAPLLADIIITGALTYYLARAIQISGFTETNSILSSLILHLIANNGLTAIMTVIQCTLYFYGSPWYLIFLHSLGHLYTSAALSSLNARISMRQLLQKATERPHLQFATTAPPLGQEVVVVIETQVQLDSFEAKDYQYFQSLSTASNKRNSTTNSTIVPSVSAADRPFQMRVNTIEELLESRKA